MIISSKSSPLRKPIVLVLIVCTVVICTISATSKPNESTEKDLFQNFRIENFAAIFKKPTTVILIWNIIYKKNKNSYGNARPLVITKFSGFTNAKIYNETIEINKTVCDINKSNSSMATCRHEISSSYIEACNSYKIVLGGDRNAIYFTTGNFSIANKTPAQFIIRSRQTPNLTLELSLDEKFVNQECGANNLLFEIRLFYNLSSTVQKNISCTKENNSATIQCQTAKELGDEVSICNQHDLRIEVFPVFFNSTPNEVEPFKVISQLNVTNLSTLLEKNNVISNLVARKIDDGVYLEWNVSYLCTKDLSLIELTINGNGTIPFNTVIPSKCITNSSRSNWNIEFNRMSYTCGNTRKKFDRELEPCTDYVVTIHQNKSSKNNLSQTIDLPLKPQDIGNLKLVNETSNQFRLSWEIPESCKNKETNKSVVVSSLHQLINSTTRTTDNCNSTHCTVFATYANGVSTCTPYTVRVGQTFNLSITLYPDIGNMKLTNVSSSQFQLSWEIPAACENSSTKLREIVKVWNKNEPISLTAVSNTDNCNKTHCDMSLTYANSISPCTLYTVGDAHNKVINVTTLPDIWKSDLEFSDEYQSGNDSLEVEWLHWTGIHQDCKQQFVRWNISLLIGSRQPKSSFFNESSHPKYRVNVTACKTYNVIISAIWKGGRIDSSTKSFKTKCPSTNPAIPISVALVSMFGLAFAILVAVLLSRCYNRFVGKFGSNQSLPEKLTIVSSNGRGRIPSISRMRIPSMSRHRASQNTSVDLNTLPQMENRPLSVRQICSFDVQQAKVEFSIIQKLAEIESKVLSRTSASRIENKCKNRFVNTHPFDFNRVVLSITSDDDNEDYINASFIPGFSGNEKEYIAAQGPKENTCDDFWRMIWEQGVRLIAMVTSLNENGRRKCEKYWPDREESLYYGDLELCLLEEIEHSFYTVRIIGVSNSSEDKRKVKQYHFTAWPDFESPEEPEELIRFIEVIRRQTRKLNISVPTVVHCSAGVGRTGTLIAIDYLIQQVLTTDVIDVPSTVRHLRRFRLSMVQSESQYVFLYACIAHYVKTRLNLNEPQA